MAEENKDVEKKPGGIVSRIWNGIFSFHRKDDFEKRLQHISKEEAAILSRMKKRSNTWKGFIRHLIVFSVVFEVIAVGYAILTTQMMDLNWKMRAFRVLPMFLLPGFSFFAYSSIVSFMKICDRKDQKTLEMLRTERQTKIDELKERSNYYITQQLIQRYDPDPAAKAAAASVLASKLGADSGLKVYLAGESNPNLSSGKSTDTELVQSSGLRNRKQLHSESSQSDSSILHSVDESTYQYAGTEDPQMSEHNQLVVDHYSPQGSNSHEGGWIARLAALLVGEDPTQSYALICGKCHMHNGLSRKEDFPYITYYCPHCKALNQPKQLEELSGFASPTTTLSGTRADGVPTGKTSDSVRTSGLTSNSLVRADLELEELPENFTSGDSMSDERDLTGIVEK